MKATTKENFSVNYDSMLRDILEKPATISQCYSTFHNFSINNQFLAFWQLKSNDKEISPIASYGTWQKLGRYINKGEKALWLWQPFMVKEKDPITNEVIDEKLIFKFKKGWFALSQTNGKELKNLNNFKLNGFNFKKCLDTFKIKYKEFDKLNGNLQGYANTKDNILAINPLAEDYEMTTWHEIAHIVLKHNKATYGKDLKELEAESVAYIIGSILNLDEDKLSRSRGYVQSWFKDNKIPEKHAKNIMSTAQKILKAGLEKVEE